MGSARCLSLANEEKWHVDAQLLHSATMNWIFLAIAVAGDAAGTVALERASRGHYRRYLSLGAAAYLLAVVAFAQALQPIPVSVADAVYFAGATALVAAISVTWLGERPCSPSPYAASAAPLPTACTDSAPAQSRSSASRGSANQSPLLRASHCSPSSSGLDCSTPRAPNPPDLLGRVAT